MRYLPLTDADRAEMLAVIGAPSIDALFADVPAAARLTGPVDLPRAPGRAGGRAGDGRLAAAQPRRRARGRSSAARAPIATMCRPASTT